MNLKRRQFLFLGGVVGGGILAGATHKVLSGNSSNGGNNSTPAPTLTNAAIATKINPVTNPAPAGLFAPTRGDVRILVISDLNSAYGSTDYEPQVIQGIKFIPDWQPDLVLCSGDMVAGQYPSLTKEQIVAMWAGFDRHIAEPIRKSKIPYGFTLGNHDASGALSVSGKFLFKQERNLAADYWNDSNHATGLKFVDRAGFPFYYTFEANDIFYLVWDASTGRVPKDQIAWAEKSLASDRAQAAKMRIAIGHLPLYAVAIGREDLGEILADAEKLRSMLERYKVHTYISGHDHSYYPAHKGKLQLLHTGALGSGPRPLLAGNLPVMNTLTVVDITLASQSTVYTTYNMNNLKVVDQKTLPRVIAGPTGLIMRRDLEMSDLTPQERSLKYEAF